MKPIIKYTKSFAVIGIVATIVGYFILLYQSYNLNSKIEEQKQKKEELTKENEFLLSKNDSLKSQKLELEKGILEINQNPKIAKEVSETLIKEQGISTDYFQVTKSKDKSSAEKYENDGFQSLIDKNIELAILSFTKSENSFNGYHQVYEISKYLRKNKNGLLDKTSTNWKATYKRIVTDFSWGMPENYKDKLEELSK